MKFMSSSLDVLIKILSHNDSKYLSQEFSGGLLELVKQKHAYPYDYMKVLKYFLTINCLIDVNFTLGLTMSANFLCCALIIILY